MHKLDALSWLRVDKRASVLMVYNSASMFVRKHIQVNLSSVFIFGSAHAEYLMRVNKQIMQLIIGFAAL